MAVRSLDPVASMCSRNLKDLSSDLHFATYLPDNLVNSLHLHAFVSSSAKWVNDNIWLSDQIAESQHSWIGDLLHIYPNWGSWNTHRGLRYGPSYLHIQLINKANHAWGTPDQCSRWTISSQKTQEMEKSLRTALVGERRNCFCVHQSNSQKFFMKQTSL